MHRPLPSGGADIERAHPRGREQEQSGEAEAVIEAAVTASRALVALAARSLADCDEDVTLPQYRMLVVLSTRGRQPATSLAAALGVAPPTATRMCDRLVRKRLIARRAGSHDRRQVVLSLTPSGKRLVDTVAAHRRRQIVALLHGVPRDRHPALIEAFHLFAAAAGEVAEPRDWAAEPGGAEVVEPDWAAGWHL